MVKITSTILCAALVAAPVLAAPSQFRREDVPTDMEAREPFGLGLLFKGVKALTHLGHHHHSSQQQQRSLEEDEDMYSRELPDDLEEREPEPFGLGLLFKGVKALTHLGHHHHSSQQQQRSLEEDEEMYSRDFSDDIEEREPEPFGLGLLFKGVKALTHLGHHHHSSQQQQRSVEEDEEMYSRDFSDDLEEREPEPFGLGLLFKGVKALTHLGHHHHSSQQQQRSLEEDEEYARDYETEDLLEREYYDELD